MTEVPVVKSTVYEASFSKSTMVETAVTAKTVTTVELASETAVFEADQFRACVCHLAMGQILRINCGLKPCCL